MKKWVKLTLINTLKLSLSSIYLLTKKVDSLIFKIREMWEVQHLFEESILIKIYNVNRQKASTVSLIFYWHCFARSRCPHSQTKCTDWSSLKSLHFAKFVKYSHVSTDFSKILVVLDSEPPLSDIFLKTTL